MSLFPITTARGLMGQPVMAYSWEIVIPDPPAAVSPYVQALSVKVRNAVVPGVENQGYDTQFGPFVYTHPGRKGYPRRLELRFEETYNRSVIEAFKLWEQQVFDEETGTGADEADLKANLWLRLLGPDPEGVQAITGAVHVYQAYPVSVSNVPVAYGDDAQLFVPVTMAYDIWRWETWPF